MKVVNVTQHAGLRLALSKYKRRYLQWRVVEDQRRKVGFAYIHIPKCGGTSITKALGQKIKLHDTALERRAKLGTARWEQIYTFSVVRHPYARVVSYYNFHSSSMFAANRVAGLPFNEWVRATLQDRALSRVALRELSPCKTWLSDESGQIIVDDYFRLEEILSAWPVVQRKTDISQPLPLSNISHSTFTTQDLDTGSRNIICTHFAQDFDEFGYDP